MTPNLTSKGHALLLRALEGEALKFTRIQLGNGVAQNAKNATALSNPLVALPLTKAVTGSQYIALTSTFSNSNITAGFRITEVGIWAEDPDNAGSEILYALGNEPEGTADYVPSKDSRILELEYSIMIFVGEAQNVTAEISESLAYASAAELKAHIENKQNPHGVTAEQVGLGSVPNVGTDDQTPNHTIAQSLTALTPKEKLSVAMGKIARAVQSLIDHLKDSTAHITASERSKWNGKAAGSHTHGAADINSGILGVTRGGTGKGGWTANRLMYPTSATSIGQMAAPSKDGMYLCQNKVGVPFWKEMEQPTIPPTSEVGTYIGGGKTGSNAKNSITFQGGVPRLIFVKQKSLAIVRYGILLLTPGAETGFSVIENGVRSNLVVGVSGQTVSWYYDSSDSHPANQLDHAGQTYSYVGVF
nr:MAG TPA: Minor structural protein [Caudoviricetes sp.]